jgi:hypothetical protein
VFEGLPIRQWRVVDAVIGPPTQAQQVTDKSPFPELPMPRDSHLLPDHSQQLLRAARAGRTSKPPPSAAEEEKENAEDEDEKKDTFKGFTLKRYTKVPRHLEEPEPEFLAKRRKGLPSLYSMVGINGSATTTTTMRKTKVKKVDAEGNTQIYEVLVPEGQSVEGEVIEGDVGTTEVAVAPTALPGTVVEGVGVVNQDGLVVAGDLVQNTPPKRRPPPPKRKPKHRGPGRGKKKVVFAEGGVQGTIPNGMATSDLLAAPGFRPDGTPSSALASEAGDTPMGEGNDGEEDEEDGEEGEEGEEAEEGEEGDDDEDHEEGELSDSQSATPGAPLQPQIPPSVPPPTSIPISEPIAVPLTDTAPLPSSVLESEVQVPVHHDESIPPLMETRISPPTAVTTDVKIEIEEHIPMDVDAPLDQDAPESAPAAVIPETQAKLEVPTNVNRDPSSSPELPLISHSRQNSLTQVPTLASPITADLTESATAVESEPSQPESKEAEPITQEVPMEIDPPATVEDPALLGSTAEVPVESVPETKTEEPAPHAQVEEPVEQRPIEDVRLEDGEQDLLGSLERHLDQEQKAPAEASVDPQEPHDQIANQLAPQDTSQSDAQNEVQKEAQDESQSDLQSVPKTEAEGASTEEK